MRCVFISNYFNHHQSDFCNALYEELGDNFIFIATSKISDERVALGYQNEGFPNYVVEFNGANKKRLLKIIKNSDVVILGHGNDDLIRMRLIRDKLTFRYQERPYRKGFPNRKRVRLNIKHFFKHRIHRNLFMLCASGYTASDYLATHTFFNKCFRFGYFPVFEPLQDAKLFIENKFKNKKIIFLWVGRFIELKRPEFIIRLALDLIKNKITNFEIDIIGSGPLETEIKKVVANNNLDKYIIFHGPLPYGEVRKYMKNSHIFLFTSNKEEGWGAVLNEAMNSACAVISNIEIGSTPYLVKNKVNGVAFNNDYDSFLNSVLEVVNNPALLKALSYNAYQTVSSLWNGKIAAERFLNLCKCILEKRDYKRLYEEGPCSLDNYKSFTI